MRARGLKLIWDNWQRFNGEVAPHAGAWIETYLLLDLQSTR